MKMRLFVAALAAVALVACAHAPVVHPATHPSYPFNDPWYPTARPFAESRTMLPQKYTVGAAVVEPMIDPSDAYAITFDFPLQQSMSQCPILPHWTFKVSIQPQLDGTRVYDACPSAGCYCAIFVPDEATAANYTMVIARFRQGAPRMTADDGIQFTFPDPAAPPVKGSR